ncbi:MAG: M24 family metallopeptidase [Actinobacteria bacterium]|nr:M24 family metallopeptidase [Actinomycetota bacterium]
MNTMLSSHTYAERLGRARAEMKRSGVDAMILSLGHDMPYLMGYLAMPLERLTMLVIPQEGETSLIIPRLEGPRVHQMNDVFTMVPWNETEDPVAIAHALLGSAQTIAVGDQMWSRFLVDLLVHRPNAKYVRSVTVMEALRSRKDAAEVAALVAAGAAADRVAAQLHAGEIPMVGRTEAEVSADISARLIAEGHQKVNFAIVAAGENAASPHHHAGDRVIQYGEIVLCDFGGTMNGYCSDITRCVHIGEVPQDIADAYAVLLRAQAAGVNAGVVGSSCENVDAVTRAIIDDAGYGEYFVHRTGHGIGMEEHEDPYMVSGNATPIAAGHAYSVEPGIYVPGKWGMRLEDIVVATDNGPMAVNHANHHLVVLDR